MFHHLLNTLQVLQASVFLGDPSSKTNQHEEQTATRCSDTPAVMVFTGLCDQNQLKTRLILRRDRDREDQLWSRALQHDISFGGTTTLNDFHSNS